MQRRHLPAYPSSSLRSMLFTVFAFCALGPGFVSAASTNDWKPRSIYQIFTDRFARSDGSTTAPCNPKRGRSCGGTWKGIVDHLGYIQGMGFDAIMISPVTQNVRGVVDYGDAHHGYWPDNLYEVNHAFGTQEDLVALSKALHSRGMYLMVDVVINNMAYITNGSSPGTTVNYSTFVPFNDKKYFHPYCKITDYDNYKVAQKCWLGDNKVCLPDLNTEDKEVTKLMKVWIENLISNFSVDGLRVDAAKHVNTEYLRQVVDASGVFATGEVYERKLETACEYQKYIPSVPNYPVYFAMIDAFTKGNMSALVKTVENSTRVCDDTFALAAFSENHDLPRFPSYKKDMSLAKNVIAFTILSDGIPMYYQGQEQHFSGDDVPTNREAVWLSKYNTNAPLYHFTAAINKIRRQAIRIDRDYLEHTLHPLLEHNGISSFKKGVDGRQIISVYSSHGEDKSSRYVRIPRSGFRHLDLVEITTCRNYTLDGWGALRARIDNGEPRIFFPTDQMGGSGLCGFGEAPFRGSKKQGNGTRPIEDNHWSNSVKENPKWGRRPGREGSRPFPKKPEPPKRPKPKESRKGEGPEQSSKPKKSGSQSLQNISPRFVVQLLMVVLVFWAWG